MDISVKIDKLKKALKSPTTPEALKGQLQKQIKNLEAQLASETISDTEEIAYRWEINDLARNNKITLLKKKGDNTKYYITNENLEKYKSKGIRDVDMMIFIDSKLNKEVVSRLSELKGILPHPKKPKVGDFVKVNLGYKDTPELDHYGKITDDYSDFKQYVGDENGYKITGIGDRLKPEQFEVISKAEYDKGILLHPKPKKPRVARKVKNVTKKYYAHRDIKSVTVIENGKKVVYKGEDVLNGAQFLAKGGKVEEMATYYPVRAIVEVTFTDDTTAKPINGYHIKNDAKPIAELGAALATEEIINNSIETNPYHYAEGGETDTIINLYPLELVPLSTQLQRITGDSLNTYDYVDENGNEYSTNDNAIIIHKSSGKKFRLPLSIFRYIDGYNLVHNIFQKKITVYETGALVAEIKDGKLDFSNKDKSVVIDRTKVRKQFENGFIPDAANARNFYQDVEQELLKQYALYEDVEDDKDSEEAKKINKKIQELEGFLHKLERKYAEGGTTEEGVDLFEDYDNIPADVQEVLDNYSQAFEDGDYDGLAKAHEEVNKLGYTFDYYLDGQAYDLRKIGQKGKVEASEEFAKGGWVKDHKYLNKSEAYELRYAKGKNRKGYMEKGGLTSGSGDFDYIKFLDYVQPKVAATLLENNITLLNDYTIVHDGKEYEPEIIYKGINGKANALSVGYFADNDPQLKLLLSIDFELDEMEYHIRSKVWNINDVDMYAKGGWVKDHKYLNKAEAYEMRYAKGKNRKGYMEKGGEVFDYKNQYDKTKIKSIADVEAFFNYLYDVEKISFHPDDEFLGNMNDDYTKKQAINLDRYMLDCFDVCEKEKKDIYGIAANPMLLKPHLVVGRKAKGVSVKKIADMHNVTEKYLRKQLQRGQKVELEHTTDESVAYAIAKDHIYENPDYYILLEQIEMKAKGGEVNKKTKLTKGEYVPHNKRTLAQQVKVFKTEGMVFFKVSDNDWHDLENELKRLKLPYGDTSQTSHDLVVYDTKKFDYNLRRIKPKRQGSQIFAKAAEIREPGEKWQEAVRRANLLLKK